MNDAARAADYFTLGVDLLRAQLAQAARYCALDGTRLMLVEGGRRCPSCYARDGLCIFCDGLLGRAASSLDAVFGPACADCCRPDERSESTREAGADE